MDSYSVEFTKTYTTGTYTPTMKVRITVSDSYDASTNKSTVTLTKVELYSSVNFSTIGMPLFGKVTLNSTVVADFEGGSADTVPMTTSYQPANYGSGTYGSVQVSHNTDGSGSVTIGVTVGTNWSSSGTFGAWAYIYDNNKIYGVDAPQSKSVSLTPHTTTLTYNANASQVTNLPSPQSAAPGTFTISSTKPVRVGYTFYAWYLNTQGTGTKYNPGDSITISTDTILYAKWEKNSYTLTTARNNNSYGTVTAGGVLDYQATKVLTATPTNATGYTTSFTNWTLSGTGSTLSSTTSNPTTFTMGTANATVTANFNRTPNTYTVHFDGNGSTSGTMSDESFTYDTAKALTRNSFTKTNHNFIHWNTLANDTGTSYSDGATVKNLATSGTITLYAIWSQATYSITYNANGHGTAPASQTKQQGVDLTLRAFINPVDVDGDTSTYTITGNANGGTWSGSNGSATSKPTYRYTQNSWNTAANGSGASFPSQGIYTLNADNTLYAQWTQSIKEYTYTYILPTGTPTNTEVVTIEFKPNGGTTTKSSEGASRAMIFNGWWTAATGGIQRTGSSKVQADEIVYAHYNQGSGTFSSITLPTASQCTKSGNTLLGWSYSPYTTTPDYEPGETIYPTTSDPLFAVWDEYGLVYINNEKYQIQIYNGTSWERYRAYIGDGTQWIAY